MFLILPPSRKAVFVLITLLFCPTFVSADVLISEFSIGGGTGHTDDDFIELYNSGSKRVVLERWKLRKRTKGSPEKEGSESSIREFGKNDCIAPQGFFLWTNSKAQSAYRDLANTTSSATLSADGSLALFDDSGHLQDAVIFGSGHNHPFLSTITLTNPASALAHARDPLTALWQENLPPTPTPAAASTCDPEPSVTEPPLPHPLSSLVRFNEIFPNPSTSQDQGEYIELYNAGDTDTDLSGWKITDATKTGHFTFPSGTTLKKGGYLSITDQEFSFSLNNTHETLSLFDASNTLQDTVSYTKSSEDASLNWTENGWRGSKTLTPGQPNILSNTLPATQERVPKKGYRGVYIDFRANGTDADGDTLKYVWDFGDGHKSYKGTTRHRYEKTGTYTVMLTARDGSEETVETFSLAVKNFDPPKLRITALMPNPAGRDTDAEWIEIKNHSKKSVDLFGYSIATGTKKKLTNHPLRASFVIPKKSSRTLTRKVALFTLPNEKGRIELRSPDGRTIHALKYAFETSLTDDTVLRKEKGKRITASLPAPPLTNTLSTPTQIDSNSLTDIQPTPNPLPETSTEEEPETSPLEILEEQAQRERMTRLLTLTTRGTSIVFSDKVIDNIASLNKKQEVPSLVSTPSPESPLTHKLILRANTWLNSLSVAPEPVIPPSQSPLPTLLDPSEEPHPEPLPLP